MELPELRSSYQADPDRAAREAGIFAPAGSDERKMLEDRINSTEPFATFSLTNSLAGYLLLAIVLVTGLLVRGEAREQPIWTWVTVLCIVLLLASSLLLTKSRTALIAGMLAIGWLVWRQIIGRPHRRRGVPVSWMVTGIVGGSLALVLGFGGFLLGYWDFRVISEAPMSLRFRLDYWRSTAAIVRDYPWFGAGPGNFRSVYSEYRPPEALELVADPHNWILEATAAGGVPLGLFTCGLMFWLGLRLVRDDRAGEDGQNLPVDKATKPSKLDAEATELRDLGNTPGLLQSYLKLWTGWHLDFGMVVGLVIASFWQIYEESTFPIDFYLRSILVCVVLRLLVQPWVRNGRCGRPTVIAAAVGVMIHLLGAGGWSVPGVIFPLAMVVGAHLDAVGKPARDRRWGWQRGVGVAVAFAIVTGYVVSTLVPVRASLHQVVSAQRDFDRGNLPSGLRDLRQAADADPFDPIPCIRGADGAVSGLLELDNGNLRASFEEFLADAAARDPRNQLILRRGGELYLQLYQRWGRAEDLEAAHLWFEKAARRYPTDASLAAQLALIERALGHVDEADQWETKARELDDVNPWRNLSNAYVLDVVQVPRGARIPLQHPAADLLTNH